MEMPGVPDHVEFWQRARRHLLKYGGEFVDFVPVRAEGAFLDDMGQQTFVSRARNIGTKRCPALLTGTGLVVDGA